MSSFSTVDIKVYPTKENYYPSLEKAEDGWHYRCVIQVTTPTDHDALLDRTATVTAEKKLGREAWFYNVESGQAYSLIVPRYAGTLRTYASAFLVALGNLAHGKNTDGEWECTADFIVLDPTP